MTATAPAGGSSVGYVLSAYPVISQTFVRNEVAALRGAGVEVHVVTMGGGDGDVVDPEWAGPWTVMPQTSWGRALRDGLWWCARPRAVLRLWRAARVCSFANPKLVLRGVPTAARALRGADAGRCHTHFGWRGNVPALYVGALMDVPVSATVHATDIFMPHAQLGRRLRAMDAVVTVCQSNVAHVTALGVDPSRVHVVPCGIDTAVDAAPEPRDAKRLLSVGRLVPKKGFDTLLTAFARAVKQEPSASLRIIGDGPLRAELEAQVTALGLQNHVELVGPLPHDDVLREVREAAVFVLACRTLPNGESDAMPVAIREAMVRARPVIATAVAGIPESVDEQVGWLVPEEDETALAAAITAALADPDGACRRGLAGRERARSSWSLAACREQLQQVWKLADGRDAR